MEIAELRVMIADDELHVRTVLRAIVKGLPGSVVGEAENGTDVLALYRQVLPDLLLLDIAELICHFPDAQIIMLTGVADSDTVEKCIEAGACGYIRKDTPSEEMKEMIRSIVAE